MRAKSSYWVALVVALFFATGWSAGGAWKGFWTRSPSGALTPATSGDDLDLNGGKLIIDADGDSYVVADGDDDLGVYLAGAEAWSIQTNYLGSTSGRGGIWQGYAPSGIYPTLNPRGINDIDSGIGSSAADAVTIVAGQKIGLDVSETSNVIAYTYYSGSGNGTHAGYKLQSYYDSTGTFTAAATQTIDINIPAGSKLVAAYCHVKSALAGGETWEVEFNDGAQVEDIASAQAVDKNTNVPFHSAGTETDDTTDIIITKTGGGAFTAQGEIECVAWAWTWDAWDND